MNESANEIINRLIRHIEKETCMHEDTHRGGAIWEICDQCGEKWADDRGGKPDFEWPDCLIDAYKFLDEQKNIKNNQRESKPMNESALQVIAELYPIHGIDFWKHVQMWDKHELIWVDCFHDDVETTGELKYRVIHHVHRVNGIECPAPMSQHPKNGDIYHCFDTVAQNWRCRSKWSGDMFDLFRFKIGNCFHTEEDMQANFYAHFPHMREGAGDE